MANSRCIIWHLLASIVIAAVALVGASRVYASPSVLPAASKVGGNVGLNDVHRVKHVPGTNPFEKLILEYMEKVGLVDDSKRHVKYLLNEQESFDFSTRLSAVDILHRSKFEYQTVNVTSHDGYITRMVRIINPLVPASLRKLPPVVLYAGQGVSSSVFLVASMGSHSPAQWPVSADWPHQLNGAKRSLAITLANNGYDVWLVGARGTDEENSSRVESHRAATAAQPLSTASSLNLTDKFDLAGIKLDEKLAKFISALVPKTYWSFSHDEIIKFEFKAQLAMVLKLSKQEKLSLVTYSNGGFIAYAFAASEAEFASRHIDTMINLAPAVYTNRWNLVLGTTGLLSSLAPPNSPLIDRGLDSFARGLWFKICRSRVARYTKCKTALNLLYGFSDNYQTHLELKLLDYIGKPMSLAGFRQTLQCSYLGRLQQYDHGIIGNLVNYRQLLPPVYDLKRVALPRMFVLTGERDSIVDVGSANKLMAECGRPPVKHITVPGYNHLDMIAGWDVDERVNTPVLNLLDDRYMELSYYVEDRAQAAAGHPGSKAANRAQSESVGSAPDLVTTDSPLFRQPALPASSVPAGGAAAKTSAQTTPHSSRKQAAGRLESQNQPNGNQPNRPQQQRQEQVTLGQNGGVQLQEQQQTGNSWDGGQQQRQQLLASFAGDQGGEEQDGEHQGGGFNSGGDEMEALSGPSGTLGWSDQELELTARGLARIPQAPAARQLAGVGPSKPTKTSAEGPRRQVKAASGLQTKAQ